MEKQKFDIKRINNSTILFNGEIIKKTNTTSTAYREIYKAEKYVIKFDNPKIDNGAGYQCRREYDKWRIIRNSKMSIYFVPILRFGRIDGRAYVIQPKIEIVKKKRPNWAWEIVYEAQEEFNLNDLHSGNWTFLNNNVLIFDYAF
jgi:hypothetical protein